VAGIVHWLLSSRAGRVAMSTVMATMAADPFHDDAILATLAADIIGVELQSWRPWSA